jgi:glycosyltransferase involved in cell wall biosynthesis
MSRPLRIVHILRAPVGGLFRHVIDLAWAQARTGCEVAVIADSISSDRLSRQRLDQLAKHAQLGVVTVPMPRLPGPGDLAAMFRIRALCRKLNADVVHGHGAKGGLYARLANLDNKVAVFYTPHGGSLHYNRCSPMGALYLGLEKLLLRATDGVIFECAFSKAAWQDKIGLGSVPARIVHNGLRAGEFDAVKPAHGRYDFLFIGELRKLKGLDVFLAALSRVSARALIVGSGPDEAYFKSLAGRLIQDGAVEFRPPMPARQAFALSRCVVVPSRKEAFPYIVLEAAAAGMPMIASRVGGIPEIFGPCADLLIEPGDDKALASAMAETMTAERHALTRAAEIKKHVAQNFAAERMANDIMAFYLAQALPRGRSERQAMGKATLAR